MTTSEEGRRLLSQWEGMRLKVYRDVAGFPTIGIGHLLSRDEATSGKIRIRGEPVRYAEGLTEPQVLDLLAQDIERYERAVSERVKVPVTQEQFDALVSFAFNVGIGAFDDSTLLRLVNRRENEIRLWNSA